MSDSIFKTISPKLSSCACCTPPSMSQSAGMGRRQFLNWGAAGAVATGLALAAPGASWAGGAQHCSQTAAALRQRARGSAARPRLRRPGETSVSAARCARARSPPPPPPPTLPPPHLRQTAPRGARLWARRRRAPALTPSATSSQRGSERPVGPAAASARRQAALPRSESSRQVG